MVIIQTIKRFELVFYIKIIFQIPYCKFHWLQLTKGSNLIPFPFVAIKTQTVYSNVNIDQYGTLIRLHMLNVIINTSMSGFSLKMQNH